MPPHLTAAIGAMEISWIPLERAFYMEDEGEPFKLTLLAFHLECGVVHKMYHVHRGTHSAQVHTLDGGRERAVFFKYTE